jgi:hypothetical protein
MESVESNLRWAVIRLSRCAMGAIGVEKVAIVLLSIARELLEESRVPIPCENK